MPDDNPPAPGNGRDEGVGVPRLPPMAGGIPPRRLNADAHPGVTIVRDDAATAIKALKAKPGRDIWLFGGGELFRSLADLGVVDSVEVVIAPILLGAGLPLYPGPAAAHQLTLRSHRVFEETGLLMLEYAVRR